MILGFDIGGTKCAVITADMNDGEIKPLKKEKCATRFDISPEEMIDGLIRSAENILDGARPEKIGISCGGPLDSRNGIILGPPNLPGWDEVHISERISRHFGVPALLQNDANACAVAEWKFGAGMGADNMVFLTFGTGLGAGLILNGRLYTGTNDNAGEAGHIRLERFGPVGYGKAGSFEGFCSGGGLRRLGAQRLRQLRAEGGDAGFWPAPRAAEAVTAKDICTAAQAGDGTAQAIVEESATYLGMGLSILIDLFNPERIVIGSIFARAEALFRPGMEAVIAREALAQSAAVCRVVPAQLGDSIGDVAALTIAIEFSQKNGKSVTDYGA